MTEAAFQQCVAPDCAATYRFDAKALVGRYGFGCEPASAATVAGLRRLIEEHVVSRDDRVVCVLTGHALKDPHVTVDDHGGAHGAPATARYANPPLRAPADLEAIAALLEHEEK